MLIQYTITFMILAVSFYANRKKTIIALNLAKKKFFRILPQFLMMLTLVSVLLYVIPDRLIVSFLGSENLLRGTFIGSILGTLSVMPGFIAFPLAGILLDKGISYMAIASFTTTLMLVGFAFIPVEKEYFGWKFTLIRLTEGYIISIIIAILVGLFFGELTL